MKPEWPLYGIGLVGAVLILVAQIILGWSDQTTKYALGGWLALVLWTYLPLVTRRREKHTGPKRARA